MPAVDLGGRRIEYSVVRGTSRRYTYMKFRADMTLEVILPRGRKVDVEEELRAKAGWIARESQRVRASRHVIAPGGVMFEGRTLEVRVSPESPVAFNFDRSGGVLTVRDPDRRALREHVRRWFLAEASSYVVRRVGELSKAMCVRPVRVDVREIGKWGYCTRGGRLSFSWQLAALSPRLRDYVVYHELTHLMEFNHSRAFKRVLEKACPDYRERERELDLVVPYDRLGPPG